MNRTSYRRGRAIAAVAVSLALANSAPAANVFWNVAGGGAWDTTSNNWIGGSPVTTRYVNGDNATFANAAGGTITIAAGIAPGSTVVNNASGLYTFAGAETTGPGALTKTAAGQLVLSNASNSFSAITVQNAGGVGAMGSGAHLTLGCTANVALFGNLTIGIPTATTGNVAKVNLNGSSQLVDNALVRFDSNQFAYFSVRGNSEAIGGIVSVVNGVTGLPSTGGVIENGNLSGAINADGSLLLVPAAAAVHTFSGIIRDADVNGGTGKFSLALSGAFGGGTQVLAGAASGYTYTGSTTVTGGTLRLETSLTRSPLIQVVNNGTMVLASGAGGARVIKTTGLNITDAGRLDLTDNKLITTTGVGQTTGAGGVYDGVQGYVQKACHGGAWDGAGLTSSLAAAANGLTAVGVSTGGRARNLTAGQTGTFAGQTITENSTLAMYTWAGDANLDGFISGDDYSAIDFNITVPGANGWFSGDFNYDGIISGDDYSVIDFNIVAQGTPFPTGATSPASNVVSVPEPFVGLPVAAVTLLTCHRRRRR